jgi:hypothetical protein
LLAVILRARRARFKFGIGPAAIRLDKLAAVAIAFAHLENVKAKPHEATLGGKSMQSG